MVQQLDDIMAVLRYTETFLSGPDMLVYVCVCVKRDVERSGLFPTHNSLVAIRS